MVIAKLPGIDTPCGRSARYISPSEAVFPPAERRPAAQICAKNRVKRGAGDIINPLPSNRVAITLTSTGGLSWLQHE